MKVILAKHAGFCMGVRRALGMVLDRARDIEPGGKLVTYGELIHNPQVVELLRGKGIEAVKDIDGLKGCTVTIRSHGVPPSERDRIKAGGCEVLDATCPHVLRIHTIIGRAVDDGRECVIFGDRGHAEVKALAAVGGEHARVVENLDELAALDDFPRACLVAQTTQELEKYDEIKSAASEKFKDVEIHDTICLATRRRQSEAARLAESVDAMVVVGGKHSANTTRLFEIARDTRKPAFHIEGPAELDSGTMSEFKTIGVTAGASTPNWLINAVMDRLYEIGEARRNQVSRAAAFFMRFLVGSYLYLSGGAALLTYALCELQGIEPKLSYMAASFLYIFVAHNLGLYVRAGRAKASPVSLSVIRPPGALPTVAVFAGTIAAGAALLAISAALGPEAFIVAFIAIGMALVYLLTVLPLPGGIRRLLGIPGSKDIAVALGWMAVLVLLPLLAEGGSFGPASVLALGACGILVFVRSTLFEIQNIQRDMMVGVETIPVAIGKGPTRVLLVGLTTLLGAWLAATAASGAVPPLAAWLLVVVGYVYLHMFLYHKRVVASRTLSELVIDAQFYIAGLIAFLRAPAA